MKGDVGLKELMTKAKIVPILISLEANQCQLDSCSSILAASNMPAIPAPVIARIATYRSISLRCCQTAKEPLFDHY